MAERKIHILLVEDEEAHAKLICRAFTASDEPFQITVASCLREARDLLSASPDLVIADYLLPDGQGTELIPRDNTPAMYPVLLLTSHGNEKVAVEAMKAGALDYVVKSEETLAAMPQIARRALREWGHITERRRAEEALRLRDRALEAFTQGVVITDPSQPDNPIIYANSGFLRLTGYAQDEVLGRNCRFLQGRETDPAAVAQLRAALREERPCLVQLLNYRKDGTPFWNSLSIAPVRDLGGKVTHFVGVQTDVTGFKRLEEQYRQAQKMEAIGRLAGGVAHDFNNLLTITNGYSEVLLTRLKPQDPSREMLSEIKRAGERAAALTGQLLAFSRKQILRPQVLNLNALVADMNKMLYRLVGEDIHLETVLEPALGRVKADPGQIEQILMNLVVNARDAMPTGGHLTITTQNIDLGDAYVRQRPYIRPGSYVLLAVRDTGCGMDEATRKRIFEPFFTTKEVGKGTGLGLATVYGIVKQSGGYIEVTSEPGRGATFEIYLPPIEAGTPGGEADSCVSYMPRGTETLLLVEDEDGVRSLAQIALQALGYHVLAARDGVEALRLLEPHQDAVHLLVTDVVMPRMSGRQLADRLTPLRPGLKVLYLSGYTDDALIRHGVCEDGLPFLQKPFTPTTLARKVREVLDGKS